MDNNAHGGVSHLLRMAKTQCGVAVAFAALRKPDGGFAIATFPSIGTDPTWGVETIDELVRQTWDDPELRSGKVLVRSGRVLRGIWAGQTHHTKLAAAPLSDFDAPDRPWGLICVAEPIAGHFEQDQLDLLGTLAIRLTSYLRARQEIMEGSFTFDEGFDQAPVPPAEEPSWSPTDVVLREVDVTGPFAFEEESAAGGTVPPAVPTEAAGHDDLELPLEEFSTVTPATPSGVEQAPPFTEAPEAEVPTAEAPTAEVIEAEVPTAEAPATAPTAPETVEPAPAPPVATAITEPVPPQAEAAPVDIEPAGAPAPAGSETTAEAHAEEHRNALGSLLRPDPTTGLPGLAQLLGRLGEAIGRIGSNGRVVALTLIEIADGSVVDDALVVRTVDALRTHLREDDLVARIDAPLFAVMVNLRPGSAQPEAIERRLRNAANEAVAGIAAVRSAVAAADENSAVGPEDLLRQAADRLGFT